MAGNTTSLVIQAVDQASGVFKQIGGSSTQMGQSLTSAMADSAKGIGQTQAHIDGLGTSIMDLAGKMKGVIGAGLVTGIGVGFISSAKDMALAVYDLRRALGGTATDASVMMSIGKYAGISTEEATGYFTKFGKKLSDVRDDMKKADAQGTQSNDILSRMGITLQQLDGKSVSEVFGIVSEKFKGLTDASERSKVALELFGKSGGKVAEMMGLTGTQLDAIKQKAEALGLDDKTVDGWKNLSREMNVVTGVGGKLVQQIGNDMLPALQSKISALKEITSSYGTLNPQIKSAAGTIVEITGAMAFFRIAVTGVTAITGVLTGAVTSVTAGYNAQVAAAERAAFIQQTAARVTVMSTENLSANILGVRNSYAAVGLSAARAGELQLAAAQAASVGNIKLAESIMATAAAEVAAAEAAIVASSTMVGATERAAIGVRTLGSSLLTLAGGWIGVGIATIYATSCLIDYFKNKGRVDSYNPKAEVRDDPDRLGKHLKGKTIEGQWVNTPDSEFGGYYMPEHTENVQMSDAEEERHNADAERKRKIQEDIDNGVTPTAPDVDPNLLRPESIIDTAGKKADQEAKRLAEKLEKSQDKYTQMIDGLNEKIISETGTVFQTNSAKTLKEVNKMNIDLREMVEAGVPEDDILKAQEKIKKYQELMNNKYDRERSWTKLELQNNTGIISENTSNDERMVAEWVKNKSYTEASKASLDEYKAIGGDDYKENGDKEADKKARALVADSLTAKEAAADKVYLETIRDINLKEINQQIQKNEMLITLEGKTQAEIDALNRTELQSKIAYLNAETIKAGTNKDKIIQLKQEEVSAIQQLQQISGRNIETASTEAMRRIKAQTFDYADAIVQTYNAIGTSITGHLTGILNRTESFSSGFKSVFSNMIADVENMMMKMWAQKAIMGPLEQWFGSILGTNVANTGQFTNSSGQVLSGPVKPNGKFAKGGSYQGGLALVGEEGPELINFANPGRVYTAGQTKNILSGGSNQQQPQITVNVINNTDTKVKVSQKATFDSDTQTTFVIMMIDALERNVGGIGDVVYGGAG